VSNKHSADVKKFQQEVLDFYANNGRFDLPFRRTTNPYHIHISEIMLSQTQVARVVGYYHKFITRFPDAESVANASNIELLEYWQGLGYNSRVLNFKTACKQLLEDFSGTYPRTDKELQLLKGVGPYVASAILAFAFNINAGVVDTNIRRILIHYGFITPNTTIKEVQQIAKQLTPEGKAREWNNALMDFGALHLTAQKTGIKSLGKQGKFVGSTRYIRSFIIRTCLQNGSCNIAEVEKLCKKYQHNAQDIIDKLLAEQIIYCKSHILYITE
jgi:A/G-specific adenine glycosylase